MRSPYNFIVEPVEGKRYADTKSYGDGVDFIVNSDSEDAKHTNREAIVRALPINYDGPITEGCLLMVHHNVFRMYTDMKGRLRNGRSYFKDGLYFIDSEQYFMWRLPDGDWQPVGEFCFVEPEGPYETWISKFTQHEPLMGRMAYPNEDLISNGIGRGDLIYFLPESEYEFFVNGKKMYRMRSRNITMQLNGQGT